MRTIIGGTHIGLVRQNNQDRFRIFRLLDTLSVAVLCDGMGGHNGGAMAAQLAVDFAGKAIEDAVKNLFANAITESSVYNLFSTIFAGANAIVWQAAQTNEELDGMGSTMILALLYEDTLYTGWAGDSRVYLTNPQKELQLTKDHTVVQHMIDEGKITPEEASSHPQKHYITRAIGVSDSLDFDFLTYPLAKETIILLCSDGLYDYLPADNTYPLLKECVENNNVESLIELANAKGGTDNITAIVMT